MTNDAGVTGQVREVSDGSFQSASPLPCSERAHVLCLER